MASEFYSETGLNTSGRACCCAAQGSVQRQSLAGKSGGQLLPRRSCLCVPGRGTMGPPCASSRAVTVLQAVGAGAVPGRRYDGEPVARALPPVARALTRAALRRGRLPVRAGRRSLAALGRLVALGLPPATTRRSHQTIVLLRCLNTCVPIGPGCPQARSARDNSHGRPNRDGKTQSRPVPTSQRLK